MQCPICKRPVEPLEKNPFFPFCTDRCKLIDLGRWLDGKYQIPVADEDTDDNANEDRPPPRRPDYT